MVPKSGQIPYLDNTFYKVQTKYKRYKSQDKSPTRTLQSTKCKQNIKDTKVRTNPLPGHYILQSANKISKIQKSGQIPYQDNTFYKAQTKYQRYSGQDKNPTRTTHSTECKQNIQLHQHGIMGECLNSLTVSHPRSSIGHINSDTSTDKCEHRCAKVQ